MKRLLIAIAVIFSLTSAKAQEPHTVEFNVSEIVQYYHNELTFCDFDSITGVIVQKDPSYTGTPFWIDENDQVIQANFIVITTVNDGKLLYIEKDNDLLISMNIFILEDEMPEPYTHELWLSEGVNQILQPTPQDEGYLYVWESDHWPQDSIYQGYTIEITKPGFYRCNMWDQCLHYSKVEYTVHYSPKIEYVTTNLSVNRNELHWIPDEFNDYDTIAIFRDFQFVEYWEYDMGIWVDPIFNNEDGSNLYTLRPVKYGTVMEGRSKWKTGVSLTLHHVYDETIDISFIGPDNENGTPLAEYIQFYQLYSIEENGWGLVRSMIPTEINDLYDIENLYDTLILAAVTFDGQEIYSNMIFPNGGLTKCEEQFETADKIQVFPNPVTNGILCITTEDGDYRIFNIHGQQVKSGHCSQRLDISELSSGVYAIEIRGKESTTTIKFIVE